MRKPMLVVARYRRSEFGSDGPQRGLLHHCTLEHQRPKLFRKLSRDTGHSRVPEPPDRITGTIRLWVIWPISELIRSLWPISGVVAQP